jgi:quercetin 2,3-dioxygenase
MNIIRNTEGQALKVLGDRVTVKLGAAQSPYAMSIVHVEVPPGNGTPCVTHAREEEVYYVCEGELLMHSPQGQHLLGPGDLVHVPPMTPHGYRNASDKPVRFMAWAVGGPMDGFFRDMAASVRTLPQDLAAMQAVMKQYGVEPAQA